MLMPKQRGTKAITHGGPAYKAARDNQALRVLLATKRVVLGQHDEGALLAEMCRAVVEAGGWHMAWIGYPASDKPRTIVPQAHWGGGGAYLEKSKPRYAQMADGGTPAGTAIRAGMPIVVEDIQREPRFRRWRTVALRHGYGSCVSLPLQLDRSVIGVLSMYGERQIQLGTDAIAFLCEIAEDLAIGIATARRQEQHATVIRSLSESEARFRAAKHGSLDALSVLKCVRDAGGRVVDFEFVEVNRRAEEMLGLPCEELVGRRHSEVLPSIKADGLLESYFRVVHTGQTLEEDIQVKIPSGKAVWLRHQLVPLGDGIAASARDITARKKMELELRESVATLARAEELAQIGTWTFDVASGAIHCSSGLRRLFGLAGGDSLRELRDVLEFFPPGERNGVREAFSSMARKSNSLRHERRILRKDGEERVLLFHGEPMVDDAGAVVRFTGFAQDITERKRNEAHIEYLATHDGVTSLPNRTVLGDRVSQAIAQGKRRRSERLAVLRIDLDRFAILIDGLGHSSGDEVIRNVATRLQARTRSGDTLASLGGDNFVVLLQNIRRPEDVLRVARRLQEAFAQSFIVKGREVYVTCSIGASVYPEDGRNTEALLKNADAALHGVKASGGNGFQFYTRGLRGWASRRIHLEAALRRALESEQFELHYQPQIDLKTGRICGAEALIRWRHPELGLVPPSRFIPLAEETGLIIPIDEWALKEACEQNRRWRESGMKPVRIAVNVSAKQFARGNLERAVVEMKARGDLQVGELELEVTERVVMHDIDATSAKLKRLRALGVIVSIDDFGTGYSSLSYLRRLPLDRLKIDQSFVRDLTSGSKARRLVREIIDLAHALGFGVIAEGVEHASQATFLRTHACDAAQGYYFARAMTARRFEAYANKVGIARLKRGT